MYSMHFPSKRELLSLSLQPKGNNFSTGRNFSVESCAVAKPQSLREEKPRASQTVGRCLKIQIQRTKGEALSARWGIGAWQANVSKIGEQKKKKERKKKKRGNTSLQEDVSESVSAHYGCQPPAARPRNSQEVVRFAGIRRLGYILYEFGGFFPPKITDLRETPRHLANRHADSSRH